MHRRSVLRPRCVVLSLQTWNSRPLMAAPRRQRCLVRRNGQQQQLHGVAAETLRELQSKACNLLAFEPDSLPVTLVLAEDGTIVEDNDYFLCLPPNTKFVALAKNETWTSSSTDGGTAWLEEEAADLDEVDSGGDKWKHLARQLKNDLSSIVLMSEEDLQVLVDTPCSDLAQELSQNQSQVRRLQDALQEMLDRREAERQSCQLLELYLQAVKGEECAGPTASERGTDSVDGGSSRRGSAGSSPLRSHILTVLTEKPAPELSLASRDLELVCREDADVLSQTISWEKPKTEALQARCMKELERRQQQCQALNSLRSISKGKKKMQGEQNSSKRKK